MKYYNPSNNFKAPIPREPKPYKPPVPRAEVIFPHPPEAEEQERTFPEEPIKNGAVQTSKKFQLSQDDLVILGVMFLLILNSCDDYLLLAVLGYLFLSGQKERP